MNNKPRIHSLRSQSGQSLVEMGLTMVFMIWLIAAVVDFGMGYFTYVSIRDAAQEGALYGSINPTATSAIVNRVQNSASNSPVNLATTNVAVSTPSGTCANNPLTVTVTYNYPIITPLVNLVAGSTIPLSASATSVILTNPSCP